MRLGRLGLAFVLAGAAGLVAGVPASAAQVPCPDGQAPGCVIPVGPARPFGPTIRLGPTPVPTVVPSASPSAWPTAQPSPMPPPAPWTDPTQLVTRWVLGGVQEMTCQLPGLIGIDGGPSHCSQAQVGKVQPPSPRDWFSRIYFRMEAIAVFLMLPLLLLAILQAVLRGSVMMAISSASLYPALAILLTGGAVTVTQALMAVTDSLTGFMLHGYEGQVGAMLAGLVAALGAGAAGTAFTGGASFAAVMAGLVALLSVVAIVVELLVRQALIYVVVLFLPVAFAGLIWEVTRSWSRRLVEILLAVILAKLVVVSVLVLAAAAATSPLGGGPFDAGAPPLTTLLMGLLVLAVAALSPPTLLALLPSLEVAMLTQFRGTARQPAVVFRSVAHNVHSAATGALLVQRARSGGSANVATGSGRSSGPVLRLHPGSVLVVRPAGGARSRQRRSGPNPPPPPPGPGGKRRGQEPPPAAGAQSRTPKPPFQPPPSSASGPKGGGRNG